MLANVDLVNVLVLDIETVSGYGTYEELNPTMKKLWNLPKIQMTKMTHIMAFSLMMLIKDDFRCNGDAEMMKM